MGFELETTTHYFMPPTEIGKQPSLKEIDLSGETIAISAQKIAIPYKDEDPIFRQDIITPESFAQGYRPLFLTQSDLKKAAAALGYREVSVSEFDLSVSPLGELLIPKELSPLTDQFQQAANYYTGLTHSPLNPDVKVILDLRREIVKLPGTPINAFPHCDYSANKTLDYKKPPQIFLLTAGFVGTVFYPDTSFSDVTKFVGGKAFAQLHSAEMIGHRKTLIAPAETWSAATDLHVHEAPFITVNDVPLSEQFDWEAHDNETGACVERGKACLRDFMHLVFARK